MTHLDFVNQWNNKKLERVDSSNLNQCFDLAVAYVMDVQGMPINIYSGLLNAYQIWENPTQIASQNYDFIKNTPYGKPKQGDTLVFSRGINGTAGHVVIVDSADTNVIKAFSQNDPTGSPCIMKNYSYTYVLGWLRKITNSVSSDEIVKLREEFEAAQKNRQREFDKALSDKQKEVNDIKAEMDFRCQQVRKETIEKVINHARTL